jgi:hypothetical protein
MAESNMAEEMGSFLYDIGDSLEKEPINSAVKIRDGMGEIRYMSNESSNPHLKFQRYFLSTIIDDMWKNLAMSVSRETSDEDKRTILALFGIYLQKIGNATQKEDFEECYAEYVMLFEEYIEKINQMEVDRT